MTLAEWWKLRSIYFNAYQELDVDYVGAAFTRSVIREATRQAQADGMAVSEHDVRTEALLSVSSYVFALSALCVVAAIVAFVVYA